MLLLTTVVLFVLSATLFVMTNRRRHQLDVALKRAAAPGNADVENTRQLGCCEAWRPDETGVALNQPERRWTYDQAYMVAFVNALLSQRVPITAATNNASMPSGGALEYYEGPILTLDMWFAVSFAAFIVCCASFIAEIVVSILWIHRLFIIWSCLGAVYGAADVAEDLKLRSILRHARSATSLLTTDASEPPAPAALGQADLVDAAEVDAANALTRIKMVTIVASIVGFFAFCFLLIASDIVVRTSGRSVRRTRASGA
jgi:hypothetical protein